MNIYVQRIGELLEQLDLRHSAGAIQIRNPKWETSAHLKFIKNAFAELQGVTYDGVRMERFDLELQNIAVVLNGEKDFNRYRGKTLRSEFYESHVGFKVDHHLRHCRQHENNCKAAAMNLRDWTDDTSESMFGQSQSLGDLGLSGSSKWKERAFAAFLLDIACKEQNIKLLRLSIYDGMVLGGRLVTLKELLLKHDEKTEKILVNWLKRQIEQL